MQADSKRTLQIFSFGEAPRAASLGYKMQDVIYGTEDDISRDYTGDLIAVKGASVLGQPGVFEFAIFARTETSNEEEAKFAVGEQFTFKPYQHVICNGYAGTVQRMYGDGMVEVRLPGGLVCVPASYPDCYPRRQIPELGEKAFLAAALASN